MNLIKFKSLTESFVPFSIRIHTESSKLLTQLSSNTLNNIDGGKKNAKLASASQNSQSRAALNFLSESANNVKFVNKCKF